MHIHGFAMQEWTGRELENAKNECICSGVTILHACIVQYCVF